MLVLPRKTSEQMHALEALLRRGLLNIDEEHRVREQLWRIQRGLDGEQRADRFWEDLQLHEEHYLFHNFETVNRVGFTHQMDTIFICSRFVLVLELKHIAGEITYDVNAHQLLRAYNGEIKVMGDPFQQVSRHVDWLEHFLWEIGVRNLPVINAVVVTTTSSILNKMPAKFHVFKLEGLRFKLRDWFNQYPVQINKALLTHIRDELLKRHQPRKATLPIENVKVQKGALCQCGLRMNYCNGVFTCSCGNRCRDGFQRALFDYRLLVNEWITNREFREFFGVEDSTVASKILKRLKLKSCGRTKSRKYLIPENILMIQLYKRGRKVKVQD